MNHTYSVFDEKGTPQILSDLCLDLLLDQQETWQELGKGYETLGEMKERKISCTGFSVRLQYNPGRSRSTLADVKEKAINSRPCFLCTDTLPADQKGVLYRDTYLILCNPMPVFAGHFTVSHIEHRPQAITEQIGDLLQLIKDFGPDWVVLYNGPKCGASAPDHMHFQIIPAGRMPIEKEAREDRRFAVLSRHDGVFLYRVEGVGREVVVLEGDDPRVLTNVHREFIGNLKNLLRIDEEPMINIAGFIREGRWRLIIFPRAKHRPDAFFREGDDRLSVSPAAVEMGGVIVTPVERDFDRLDAPAVEAIYREVSLHLPLPKI
jgi:hypothetical protein